MPESLFTRFDREWHCPTAIDASNLNLNAHAGVVLVGDPRSFAANMNDPKGAKPDGKIRSHWILVATAAGGRGLRDCCCCCCRRLFLGAILARFKQLDSIPLSPFGVVTVPDDFIYAEISVPMLARVEDFIAPDGFKGEVLVTYETCKNKGSFWNANDCKYCAVCFGKTQSAHNPLLSCSAEGCEHRCHAQCIAPPSPTYRCYQHQPEMSD